MLEKATSQPGPCGGCAGGAGGSATAHQARAGEEAGEGGGIVVNGRPQALPPDGSLVRLLQEAFGVTADSPAVAVAVNGRVLRRSEWPACRLAPGDRVEVVQPVPGG